MKEAFEVGLNEWEGYWNIKMGGGISYIGSQTKQNRNKELQTVKIQIRLGLSLAELKSLTIYHQLSVLNNRICDEETVKIFQQGSDVTWEDLGAAVGDKAGPEGSAVGKII